MKGEGFLRNACNLKKRFSTTDLKVAFKNLLLLNSYIIFILIQNIVSKLLNIARFNQAVLYY